MKLDIKGNLSMGCDKCGSDTGSLALDTNNDVWRWTCEACHTDHLAKYVDHWMIYVDGEERVLE